MDRSRRSDLILIDDRLRRLRSLQALSHSEPSIAMTWTSDQFLEAAILFRDRWRFATKRLGIRPRRFCDLVRLLDADFNLPEQDSNDAATDDPHYLFTHRMHVNFVSHPGTAVLPSPYEPLLQIIENGGCYSVEHCYIDVRDNECNPIGGFDVSAKIMG